MTLGRTLIVQPDGTDHLLRVRSYLSCNRRGLVFWSDGYMEGPRHPPVCSFLLHDPVNGIPFFPSDAEVVGSQVDPMDRLAGEIDEWDSAAPFAETATSEDYQYAVACMIDNPTDEDERNRLEILRHHWWWTENHARRIDPSLPLSESARGNMEAIIDMTTASTEYERLLRAELYRELSDFCKSMQNIILQFSKRRARFASQLFLLNIEEDSTLSSYGVNPYA